MLQNIRDNSQGWISKSIIGVIVVLMALTGVEAIVNGVSGNKNEVANVNGDSINANELAQAVEAQRRQLQQRLGAQIDPNLISDELIKGAALDALIERRLLQQAVANAKLGVSSAMLDQLILSEPEFQQDGRFSAERFDQVARRLGYDRLQFRRMLEEEVLTGQLNAGISGSAFVTDAEIRAFAALERQTRTGALTLVAANSSAVSVSTEALRDYYQKHASEFMTPEQVIAEYVELKREAFTANIAISDDELKTQYEQAIAHISEQRRASHILLETSASFSDEQARAKLEELRQRILAGEDFTALAREFSRDTGSANSGGDLGFAGKGVYDSAFEKALFALKTDELSAPVKSSFGWHLIRLTDVQQGEVPSFEQLKAKLERELKEQKAEQRFVEAVKNLENLAFESGNLQQPAEELGLNVQQTAPFGRNGAGEGIAASRRVAQAAFSKEVLEEGANSPALELDSGTVVVLRLKEHLKPAQQSFDSVEVRLRAQLQAERAAEAARQQGEQLIAALRKGENHAEDWKALTAVSRRQENVAPEVLETLFRMPATATADAPRFAGVALANGDYAVLRLDAVQSATELKEEELAIYRRFLLSRHAQQDFQAFLNELRSRATIKR